MGTYTNFTEVNIATALVCPSITGVTAVSGTLANYTTGNIVALYSAGANVTKVNISGVPGTIVPGWTNTVANWNILVNCVANLVNMVKGL